MGLYESLQKCKSGTLWKTSVSSFWLNGWERCLKLSRDLNTGEYKPGRTQTVLQGKRECCSIGIRDRVYQRSLNDNVVYPVMSKSLVRANCACQTGKGTGYARDLLERYLKNHWHHYGTDGWVLQLDIRGYYPNMRHDVAKAIFAKHLDADSYAHVSAILDTQYAGDVGYKPGSQLVQIAGISVLSPLDHMIKERLRCKHYIRYMDDMILLSHDREYLVNAKRETEAFLASMGYELNAKKTRLMRISNRIPFLGLTFELTESGKVIRRKKPDKVRQERRKIRRMVRLVQEGAMTREKCDECVRSWVCQARKECTSSYEADKMERYYKTIWKEIEHEANQGQRPCRSPRDRAA